MDTIHIVWNDGNGKMTVYLNGFFPTSQARVKKLLSIIRLDYEHEEALIASITEYLAEAVPTYREQQKDAARKWSNVHQCRVDMETHISERKWANGVRMTKDELKNEREKLKPTKLEEADWQKTFNRLKRLAEQTEKNLELMKEYSKGR